MIWFLKILCFWVSIIVTGILLLFVSNIIAKKVDAKCVRGRISEEQALILNKTNWNNRNNTLNGIVNEDDRVLNRDCSELSRKLMGRNIKRGPNK